MKKAGFTMIELIFVIVILGILSAVALPKFIGVSQQAHDQKIRAFIGTLNRTVGPSMWAVSIADGTHFGSVTTMCDTTKNLEVYLDKIPEEVTLNACKFNAVSAAGGTFGINFQDGNATNAPTWIESNTTTGS
ncbi:N-terminal methylation [Sulfurimonas denitrificans DSM 1251]|uniref:N-terminal methylation n=1 Tax=Sulfurimonas denitrificans (strain ATCC 33889 / DSM 1251) TaxID=326298 RepID=Q30TN4_SULDN|nr:type II secretion system protein [Sulfurimonas denitrificans]ABB43647.1 N-terminal methylation [Sulfurimonas denitrificans DSM 1251]MDD3442536.1 type II secretion system protein [Sulfurimonas denitrificans]